jgi:predicted adenine nucleotide alpha hydrolase (AANH) superfamily ATPase
MDPQYPFMLEHIRDIGECEAGAPTILVHMCCGPCSIVPIKKMLSGRANVIGYFYNPNIHPLSEFRKRLLAAKKLASLLSIEAVFNEGYSPMSHIDRIRKHCTIEEGGAPQKGRRCLECYAMRLEETAMAAKRMGFDSFTTSLLYSRHQMHDEIKGMGIEIAKGLGVRFHYEDFRAGWQEGIEWSRSMGLYRQRYCGCIYSRIERSSEKDKKAGPFGPTRAS